MVAELVVGFFMEDIAHVRFMTGLVNRIASEIGVATRFDVRNASGGISQMRSELRRFLRYHTNIQSALFDILIIVQDADKEGETEVRSQIRNLIERTGYPRTTIIAAPDPYIEAWYLADPVSIQTISGYQNLIQIPQDNNEKNLYKSELSQAFGYAPLGGIEYADEIVAGMDLYRASQNLSSLRHFIDELRSALTQLVPEDRGTL